MKMEPPTQSHIVWGAIENPRTSDEGNRREHFARSDESSASESNSSSFEVLTERPPYEQLQALQIAADEVIFLAESGSSSSSGKRKRNTSDQGGLLAINGQSNEIGIPIGWRKIPDGAMSTDVRVQPILNGGMTTDETTANPLGLHSVTRSTIEEFVGSIDWDSDDELEIERQPSRGSQSLLGDAEQLTSIGSRQHASGKCTPCAFFRSNKDGCKRGADCTFCHYEHEKPKKKQKKMCKGQRERYKKLVMHLTQQILDDPVAFDPEECRLPPSLADNDKAKAKLMVTLKGIQQSIIATGQNASGIDEHHFQSSRGLNNDIQDLYPNDEQSSSRLSL